MYDYHRGTCVRLDKLLALLSELPTDAWIWPTPMGGLSVYVGGDATNYGRYVAYVDLGYHESVQWADGRQVAQASGDGTPG